jgi:hypothetical protein
MEVSMEDLMPRWRELYDRLKTFIAADKALADEDSETGWGNWLENEADWECLCVGWCLGQGLSVDEAHDFYQRCIKEGVY